MKSTIPRQLEQALADCTATRLAQLVREGEVSAQEVLDAHLARIAELNPKLNALIWPRTDAARAEARGLDARRAAGEPLGPLAGVPITIKDCFDVAGTPVTMGCDGRRETLSPHDGPLAAALRQADAIVVGKTNIPQLMMLYETDNPVFGRTQNPWDLERGPGGSSGGDAAIVAARGAALALGTDMGGSIRQPAHVCGLHAFKPTPGLLTTRGCTSCLPGMEAITIEPGPIARSVDDLSLAMQVLAGGSHGDPLAHAAQWPAASDDPPSIVGVRIALWTYDGYYTASPAIVRAVEEAAAALRAAGAIVERFEPPAVDDAVAIYCGLVSADGGAVLSEVIGRGRVDPQLRQVIGLGRLPRWSRPLLAWLARRLGQMRRSHLVVNTGRRSTAGYWQLVRWQHEYTARFFAALAAGGYQAMLMPPHALPATPHGTALPLIPAASYSLLANLLGIPAGVVAASRVRPGEELAQRGKSDPSDRAATLTERGSAGLPVGVQIAGLPWGDALVLALLKTLETAFRRSPSYPTAPPRIA